MRKECKNVIKRLAGATLGLTLCLGLLSACGSKTTQQMEEKERGRHYCHAVGRLQDSGRIL